MANNEKKPRALTSKSLFSAGGIVLILVIIVLVNVVFSKVNLRWDATEDKLYSLSEGTNKILSDLKQDVIIKVFYSEDNVNIPVQIKTYARRMLDFLSEYEYHSSGKVKIEIINPRPDTEEEDWAMKYGIEGLMLPTGEKIYLGLVALCADQEEVIPKIDPSRESNLEYDITRIISRLKSPKKPKIGIISGLPVFGEPPNPQNIQQFRQMEPWMFISELKKTYDVEEISATSEKIDSEYDLVILIHPKNMDDKLQYAVDQYILSGKNLIVFVDPFSVSDSSQGEDKSSCPEKLFKAWGLKMEKNKIIVDFDNQTRLRAGNNEVEDNPMWLSLKPEAFNSKDITTADLDSMMLPVAGSIEKVEGKNIEYEPLLQSSENAAMTDSFKFRFGANFLRRDFEPAHKKFDLAVRLRGMFETAFPDGIPKDQSPKDAPASEKPSEKGLTKAEKKSTLIIVADTDMLFDSYYVSKQNFLGFNLARMFNDNLTFLLNTTEMLTGSDALIGIRSRGKFERPFTTVQELEKKAQTRWLEKEQSLVKEAEETNQKIRELERQKDASQRYIISDQQEAEMRRFQDKKRQINAELKDVRRKLRADIEDLGLKIKVINIALMPLLVAIAGITYGIYRRRKSLS